uniref:Cytochrome P450 n=1 Tax=Anopheles atroparvus TaxID=41427 RepID=A0AAG5CQ76_ANOAO
RLGFEVFPVSVLLWSALLVLILYRFYLNNIKRPPNYPPGPPRIPFFEDYALLLLINGRHLHRAASKLARYYRTKILGLSLVGVPLLVVHDLSVAREILTRHEFDGRPSLFLALMREKHFKRRGIFFTDGLEWKDQRWFFLRHLRDYGFGRRSEQYEQEVEQELSVLVDVLKTGPQYDYERDFMRDGFVKCPDIFFIVLGNAFLQILVGERFHRSKAETVLTFFPWLRFVFPYTIKYNKIRDGMLGLSRFIETTVRRQQNTFDPSNIRNFIDQYIREMQRHTPQEDTFTFQCKYAFEIMFIPASTFPHLSLSPFLSLIVGRIQQEIEDAVGTSRLPTLDDRINMPYTEATLRESLRIDTLIPSGIVHRTIHNTIIQGYAIPENTLVLTSLEEINNQPEVWGDPKSFRPERFLADDGKLAPSKDRSLPFGTGKRLCAGETFARNTLFLVLTTIMQNFSLQPRTSDGLPDVSKRRTGFVTNPDDFWIKFVPR